MVQTFDFMSKKLQTCSYSKVTFSAKKELLTQPFTRKPCIQNVCVHQSNNVVFTHPFP